MQEAALGKIVKAIGGGPVLSLLGTLLVAGGSAAYHASVQLTEQGADIKQQGAEIHELFVKSDKRDEAIGGISIGVAQLQGQIATLNQKLDDHEKIDRAEREHRPASHP